MKRPIAEGLRWILVAMGAWLAVLAGCGVSESSSPLAGARVSGLSVGWHLWTWSSSTAAELAGVGQDRSRFFQVDHGYDLATQRVVVHTRPVTEPVTGQAYWVHVGAEGSDLTGLDLVPPRFFLDDGEGHFVTAQSLEDTHAWASHDVFRWDPEEQQPKAVTRDALEPGAVYWVKTTSGCHVENWDFSDAVRLFEQCDQREEDTAAQGGLLTEAGSPKDWQDLRAAPRAENSPPPFLFVEPQSDVVTDAQEWRVSGAVYDEDLVAFSVNSVFMGSANQSFEASVWLSVGENRVRVSAVDQEGHVTSLVRRVFLDRTPPVIHVVPPESDRGGALTIVGRVVDEHLQAVTVDGVAIHHQGGLFRYALDRADLVAGHQSLEFWAIDQAGHEASYALGVFLDEHGVRFEGPEETASRSQGASVGAFVDVSPTVDVSSFEFSVADAQFPKLVLDEPQEAVAYTRVPFYTVRGHATDAHLMFVRVNNLLASSANGPFSKDLYLEQERTDLEIVVRDQGTLETRATRTVVYDPDAPVLSLFGAHQETVYAPEYRLEGRVDDPNFDQLVLIETATGEEQSLPVDLGRFSVVLNLNEGPQRFTLRASDLAGNSVLESIDIHYKPGPFFTTQATLAPANAIGWTTQEGGVKLEWDPPTRFVDGTAIPKGVTPRYRVYRDDEPLRDLSVRRFQDLELVAGKVYQYSVSALLPREGGLEFESASSSLVSLGIGLDGPLAAPGTFEPASEVPVNGHSVSLPKAAMAASKKTPGLVHSHMTYLVRGETGTPDQLRYLRSEQKAKGGSWVESAVALAVAHEGSLISEVAMAAHQDIVVVGWIESSRSGTKSRVHLLKSEEAGAEGSFVAWGDFVDTEHWKRHLDMAFDHSGTHHMIWNENTKVYYFRNLKSESDAEGKWLSVFDETKRWVNHERVRVAEFGQDPNCEGTCCRQRNEYTYSYGLEEDPKTGQPYGAYLHRLEEVTVETPSLHVDEDKVTIVARQTRRFDNFPYRNPAWAGHREPFFGPLVPPPLPIGDDGTDGGSWCPDAPSARTVQGFMASWRTSPYACPPNIPMDAAQLLLQDDDHALTQGWAKTAFYAYDANRGHEKEWYARLYAGKWFEEDAIKVAQRPLTPGAWSQPRTETRTIAFMEDDHLRVAEIPDVAVDDGWRHGLWTRSPFRKEPALEGTVQFEETLQRWRISTIEAFESEREGEYTRCGEGKNSGRGPTGPSHPQVYADPLAPHVLYAVYEKGHSSDPNAQKNNPIYMARSEDGGQTWTVGPQPVAEGYMPVLAVAERGEAAVLYYEPDPSQPSSVADTYGQISVARTEDGKNFTYEVLNKAFDPNTQEERLHEVKAIHWNAHGADADFLLGVPNLVAHKDLWLASWVKLSGSAGAGDTVMTTRASRPPSQRKMTIVSAPARITAGKNFKLQVECVNQDFVRSDGCDARETALQIDAHTRPLERFTTGKSFGGTFAVSSSAHGSGSGAPALIRAVSTAPGLSTLPALALGTSAEPASTAVLAEAKTETLPVGSAVSVAPDVFQNNADGNYRKLTVLRDTLYSPEAELETEYQAVEGDPDVPSLVRFERAWIYSQGIALAQFARHNDPRSSPLAKSICSQNSAVWRTDPATAEQYIEGWPFSWNTKNDSWKDARLVTGANAWATHGLGSFLVSNGFSALSALEQSELKKCYFAALSGLTRQRAKSLPGVEAHADETQWLVTAGRTTKGLQKSERPWELGLTADTTRQWAYYDILDLIGYDALTTALGSTITTFHRDADGNRIQASEDTYTLKETDLALLKTPVRAVNVVTEHNLDVLSVLNHAVQHWEQLSNGAAEGAADPMGGLEGLTQWRDGLRRAIFVKLWDPEEKRVVTGGVFDEGGRFTESPHSAIDNCSWLALSVDRVSLAKAERDKLSQCLDYTIDRFVKSDLEFDGQLYRGAHYFPRDFKDPYIEESLFQEDLYHLEATTGLILALLYFADSYEDEYEDAAARYRTEAGKLWADMQRFVAAHGAAYSSVRIQDLMTQLPSATAAIWYIDVYDYFADRYGDIDRPLKSYVHGKRSPEDPYPFEAARAYGERAWARLQESAKGGESNGAQRVHSFDTFASSSAGDSLENEPSLNAGGELEHTAHAITLLDDQALAIIAAVNQGDHPLARTWLHGLLATSQAKGANWGLLHLPHAAGAQTGRAVAPYYQTSSQLLAAYALLWYLQEAPDSSERDDLVAVANTLLSSIWLSSWDHERARLFSGAGDPEALERALSGHFASTGEEDPHAIPSPVFAVSLLEDHVYGYFVLKLGLALFPEWATEFQTLFETLRETIRRDFWAEGNPVLAVDAEGSPIGEADRLQASVLYAFFAFEEGDLGRGRRAMDLISQHGPADLASTAPVGREAFSGSGLALLLSKRAGATIDPRLDELIWNDYLNLDATILDVTKSPDPGQLAGLLLLEHPRGFLGVDRASLLMRHEPTLITNPAYPKITTEILQTAYIDALFRLFASEPRDYVFDAHIRRLTHIDFAADALRFGVPVREWVTRYQRGGVSTSSGQYLLTFEERLLRVLAHTRNLCESRDSGLFQNVETPEAWSDRLGIPCEILGTQFGRLLKRRLDAEDPSLLAPVLERQEEVLELVRWSEQLHPQSKDHPGNSVDAFFGNLSAAKQTKPALFEDTVSIVQRGPALKATDFSQDTSLSSVAESLRNHWGTALLRGPWGGTKPVLIRRGQLWYELGGLDFARLMNPAAPEYWSREAFELRTLSTVVPNLRWTVGGQPVERPANPIPYVWLSPSTASLTRGEMETNAMVLRRLINRESRGSLPRLAAQTNTLTERRLHWMIRSGQLTPSDFLHLTEALGSSEEETETWLQQFRFLPEDEFDLAAATFVQSTSALELHLEAMAHGTFAAHVGFEGPAEKTEPSADQRALALRVALGHPFVFGAIGAAGGEDGVAAELVRGFLLLRRISNFFTGFWIQNRDLWVGEVFPLRFEGLPALPVVENGWAAYFVDVENVFNAWGFPLPIPDRGSRNTPAWSLDSMVSWTDGLQGIPAFITAAHADLLLIKKRGSALGYDVIAAPSKDLDGRSFVTRGEPGDDFYSEGDGEPWLPFLPNEREINRRIREVYQSYDFRFGTPSDEHVTSLWINRAIFEEKWIHLLCGYEPGIFSPPTGEDPTWPMAKVHPKNVFVTSLEREVSGTDVKMTDLKTIDHVDAEFRPVAGLPLHCVVGLERDRGWNLVGGLSRVSEVSRWEPVTVNMKLQADIISKPQRAIDLRIEEPPNNFLIKKSTIYLTKRAREFPLGAEPGPRDIIRFRATFGSQRLLGERDRSGFTRQQLGPKLDPHVQSGQSWADFIEDIRLDETLLVSVELTDEDGNIRISEAVEVFGVEDWAHNRVSGLSMPQPKHVRLTLNPYVPGSTRESEVRATYNGMGELTLSLPEAFSESRVYRIDGTDDTPKNLQNFSLASLGAHPIDRNRSDHVLIDQVTPLGLTDTNPFIPSAIATEDSKVYTYVVVDPAVQEHEPLTSATTVHVVFDPGALLPDFAGLTQTEAVDVPDSTASD